MKHQSHDIIREIGIRLMSASFCFILLTTILLSTGCYRTNRPANLPKLYPCSIRITQDNAPVADVLVSLQDETGLWAISGITDIDGNAEMKTHGQFPGAPTGEFVVVLEKSETESSGQASPTGGGTGTVRVYSFVDPKYRDKENSPLRITVDRKTAKTSFEIGPPGRVLVTEIKPGDI